MANYKTRVRTLRVLISTHDTLKNSTKLNDLYGEAARIEAAARLRDQQNGWLLAVLHTTRTLDTTLGELLLAKGGQRSHRVWDLI